MYDRELLAKRNYLQKRAASTYPTIKPRPRLMGMNPGCRWLRAGLSVSGRLVVAVMVNLFSGVGGFPGAPAFWCLLAADESGPRRSGRNAGGLGEPTAGPRLEGQKGTAYRRRVGLIQCLLGSLAAIGEATKFLGLGDAGALITGSVAAE
jgi:hypothetical protein